MSNSNNDRGNLLCSGHQHKDNRVYLRNHSNCGNILNNRYLVPNSTEMPRNGENKTLLHQNENQNDAETQKLIQSSRKAMTDEASCSICMDVIVKATVTNPCGHIFCASCLYDVLKKNRECPVCRSKVMSTTRCAPMDNMIFGMAMRGDFRLDDCTYYLKRCGAKISNKELKVAKGQCKRNHSEAFPSAKTMIEIPNLLHTRISRPKFQHVFPFEMPANINVPHRTQGSSADDAIVLD